MSFSESPIARQFEILDALVPKLEGQFDPKDGSTASSTVICEVTRCLSDHDRPIVRRVHSSPSPPATSSSKPMPGEPAN